MSAAEIYSPGLEGVIAGETAISTVSGGLRYRGYPVTELAEKTSFDEVAYLLLYGRSATDNQVQLAREFLGNAPGDEAWTQYVHVLLGSNEFLFVD